MQDGIVLVVEDDPTLQLIMRRMLTHLGYACEVVASGELAIARDPIGIGMIFMDIGLPGIQGNDASMVIRKLERLGKRKRVPIVALTGHSVRELCLDAGMDDFLQKPALMDDLKRMVEKWAPELTH